MLPQVIISYLLAVVHLIHQNMKYFLLFFYCILFFLLSCCHERYLKRNVYSTDSIQVSTSTIRIRVDSLRLQAYSILFSYLDKNGEEYLYTYNKPLHAIDIFNLKGYYDSSIQLSSQGPSGINRVEDLFVSSADSVFLYATGFVFLINRNGELLNKISLYDKGDYNKIGPMIINQHFRMELTNDNEKIFLYNTYPNKSYLDRPKVSTLNLNSGEVDQLPIYYSDFYQDINGNCGFLSYLNKSYLFDDLLIYNFEFESNIYSYNIRTGERQVFGGQSRYSKNLASSINSENSLQIDKHAIENIYFLHVMKDLNKPFYYRIHWGGIDYKNSNGYNSFIDKPLFLMVFNKNFEIADEIELPARRYGVYNWVITNKGLLIANSHPLFDFDEDYLSFDLITINYHERK